MRDREKEGQKVRVCGVQRNRYEILKKKTCGARCVSLEWNDPIRKWQQSLSSRLAALFFPMKKKRPIRENSSVKVEIVETQDDQTGLVLLEGSQQLQYEPATHANTDDAPSLFKKKKIWT